MVSIYYLIELLKEISKITSVTLIYKLLAVSALKFHNSQLILYIFLNFWGEML